MIRYLAILICLSFSQLGWAAESSCPGSETTTIPATVNLSELKSKIEALSSASGHKFFQASPASSKSVENVFDLSTVKTKMEQFYTMLWVLGQELIRQKISHASFTKQSVQDVLLASKVFTDPNVPAKIQTIEFDLADSNHPKYRVTFDRSGVEIPLNQGHGFYLFRNGKCQHAEKLIFDRTFSFEMKKNLGNLMVSNFQGADLFGDFGNRGFVDVDIQYVSLRSVEFFTGTQNGRVTAYVSREEFSKNKHTTLLKWVTKFVPDRSVQPIDW